MVGKLLAQKWERRGLRLSGVQHSCERQNQGNMAGASLIERSAIAA
jgi:hypothetical protein